MDYQRMMTFVTENVSVPIAFTEHKMSGGPSFYSVEGYTQCIQCDRVAPTVEFDKLKKCCVCGAIDEGPDADLTDLYLTLKAKKQVGPNMKRLKLKNNFLDENPFSVTVSMVREAIKNLPNNAVVYLADTNGGSATMCVAEGMFLFLGDE
jgi:hypothetical protein